MDRCNLNTFIKPYAQEKFEYESGICYNWSYDFSSR